MKKNLKEALCKLQNKNTTAINVFGAKEDDLILLFQQNTKNLKQADLYGNSITFNAIVHFSQGTWEHLKNLYLGSNKIGNNGCKWLSRAQLKSLEKLSLWKNEIDSFGILHLSKAQWSQLKEIAIGRNLMEGDAIKWLGKLEARRLSLLNLNCYGKYLSKAEMVHLMMNQWQECKQIFMEHGCFEDKELLKEMIRRKINNVEILA